MQKLLDKLKNIDVKPRIKEIQSLINNHNYKNAKELDSLVKELKVLKQLDIEGVSPYDAFTHKYIPVIPGQYRAPIELSSGTLANPAINDIYKNIGVANAVYKDVIKEFPERKEELSGKLYDAVNGLVGLEGPTINKEKKKNLFETIANVGPPKKGFFQNHVVKKRQNLSGRAVISPDPELDLDELSVPYKMGVKLYSPWIVKELKDRGMKKDQIKKEMNSLSPLVKDSIRRIGKERPLMLNRPPSIWEGSLTGHHIIFNDSDNIGIPSLLTTYQKADFDGDSTIEDIYIKYKIPLIKRIYLIIKSLFRREYVTRLNI